MSFFCNTPVKLSVALILYLSTSYSFADDLFDMLKRMSDAELNKNYQGIFILRKSDSLSTLRVTHGIEGKTEWESLESLNGEPRNVYRLNGRVVTVFPERKLLTVRHTRENQSLHQQLPDNIDQLAQFYSMKRLDDDRIAKHDALVVDLLPKDQFRYGYRYWVDKNTGMLLRCDLIDEDNRVVEQMMFTSLDYLSDTPARDFDIDQFDQFKQQSLDEPDGMVKPVANAGWEVGHLPKGFMLTQTTLRYMQPSHEVKEHQGLTNSTAEPAPEALLHMVYSDGLASVSVFIEEEEVDEKHLQGGASIGAMNAYGDSVDGYAVTVVGEVPAKTVQLMGQTMARISKERSQQLAPVIQAK